MANTKKYWKGLEQLNEDPQFVEASRNEFPEELPLDSFLGDEETLENSTTSRRDFLKYLGFGVAAASLAACEAPVTKAIPYLNKPEEVTPGVANYYASTYYDGNDYASVLVKTREGRPVHIAGNKSSKVTKGAINARIIGSVLSLYDNNRLKAPIIGGKEADWTSFDKAVSGALASAQNPVFLTNTNIGLSLGRLLNSSFGKKVIDESTGEVKGILRGDNVVEVDTISYSGLLDANMESFGTRSVPTYNFAKAKTVVSVGADFLGNWLDSLQYVTDFGTTRKPDNKWMSKHFQFEANMSLTGSNADYRTPVKPSEYGKILSEIYGALTGASAEKTKYSKQVMAAVKALTAAKGESIVVSGSNDKNVQIIVNAINNALGNYGKTININKPSYTKAGSDEKFAALLKEMEAGKVDVLFINGVDPVYTYGDRFKKALAKVKTTVCFATKMNDTAMACKYVAAANHQLESWSDANPVDGHFSLGQPTISPLFDTRDVLGSMLAFTGDNTPVHDFIKSKWEESVFPLQTKSLFFNDFWNTALHDGVVEVKGGDFGFITEFSGNVSGAMSAVKKMKTSAVELELTQSCNIGDGVGADNPWLQETPDPITKITWDNYVTMNPSEMKDAGYNTILGQEDPANLVTVTVNGKSLELPVVAQPGQAKGTIGIALGYGKVVGNMTEVTGKNAYPFVGVDKKGNVSYSAAATVAKAEGTYPIAATQTHQTIMGRDSIIRETSLATYKKGDRNAYNPEHTLAAHEGGKTVQKNVKEFDLWGAHPVEGIGHRWGMTIDMNSCFGCGACITACNAENNVPVVGKDEVRRGREMHWLRIDRYYSTEHEELGAIGETHSNTMEATGSGAIGAYTEMETPEDNPRVVYQPMMCQHCNHAGCETVCPVAATTHSNEGLNMMAYNRCIGTRYCANNCAYKVRRFNWFNYIAYNKFTEVNPAQDDLGRMVLNPDVVVRSRGVMEKCSMCVQRIQAGKLDAKKAGSKVMDGAIQTACSEACSTGAISFGDLNDKESNVHADMNHDRAYRVIEEVGQQPNVYYLTKVRNVEA